MKIVLDSSVAGFLLQRHPAASEADIHAQVQALLDDESAYLIVPTPTLMEILAIVKPEERAAAIDALESLPRLTVRGFDALAALAAANLLTKATKLQRAAGWQAMKVDAQVVACAVRYGADAVCALDGDHVRLAERAPREIIVGRPERFLKQLPLLGGTAKRDP